jgi:hypothetical protein
MRLIMPWHRNEDQMPSIAVRETSSPKRQRPLLPEKVLSEGHRSHGADHAAWQAMPQAQRSKSFAPFF